MPASYAHYRFGKLLLPQLPGDVRQCIQRFRRMYDVGLHGPDIFFHHNHFLDTATGRLAGTVHRMSGQELFTAACAAADSEAARAYLYGLLAHYCLDAACHPFVNKMAEQGEAGHVALESEFDRFLMELDGIPDPHRHDFSRHMKLTRGECDSVAAFYPGTTGGTIRQCVYLMGFSLRFLTHGNQERRKKLMGKVKPVICDHFVPSEPVTAWARMDSELLARFNRCVKQYPALLEQLEAYRKTGAPLGEDFAPDFNGK